MKSVLDNLQPFLNTWGILSSGLFIPVDNTRSECTLLLKIRNFRERFLCEAIEPVKGILFRDIIGPQDYFLGEAISISKKNFSIVQALKVLILIPNKSLKLPKVKSIEIIRDDGFLKVYHTKNNKLLITTV